jgi:RNA polymerase sigma factor for flagellar operon FliA
MSEVWEGRPVAADGGVRARNQQRSYVERVAGRDPGRAPLPQPRSSFPSTGLGTATRSA